jgi:hypothetical protein
VNQLDAGEFGTRMTFQPVDPPSTWLGWWDYPLNKEVFVEGIGILAKISEDSNPDTDSYSYGEIREMVFEVRDCGAKRWFKVEKASSSFDSGYELDESWADPDIDEVTPAIVEVTRWTPV